jgi:signal peptidase II
MKTGIFVCLLLGLDILAKMLVVDFVPAMAPKFWGYPYGGIPIFACLGISCSLNLVVNTGAAWSFFQGHSGVIFAIRISIILGLISYILFFKRGKAVPFPLWLIVIGAIGNGFDYLAYGHVIDFLHFCFWGASFPIFNLADCYITAGVLLLFLVPSPAIERPNE